MKIWLYGIDNTGDVLHKDWVYSTMPVEKREWIAKRWLTEYGCAKVVEVHASSELRMAWNDYIKTRYSRNGLAHFAKFEFNDFLDCEGTVIAK